MPRKHQQSYGNHVQVPEDLSGQASLTMWNHFSQKDGCFDPELVPRHQIKTKNVRQCDLADAIPVARSTLSQWCNNSRLPDANSVYLLSKALALSSDEDLLFLQAWQDTKDVRDLTGTIKLALDNGDFKYINTILASLSNDAVQQIYDTQ